MTRSPFRTKIFIILIMCIPLGCTVVASGSIAWNRGWCFFDSSWWSIDSLATLRPLLLLSSVWRKPHLLVMWLAAQIQNAARVVCSSERCVLYSCDKRIRDKGAFYVIQTHVTFSIHHRLHFLLQFPILSLTSVLLNGLRVCGGFCHE